MKKLHLLIFIFLIAAIVANFDFTGKAIQENYEGNFSPTNENVLCLYNSNSQISTEICDYYLQKRPGASSFGVPLESNLFWGQELESMGYDNFVEKIIFPLNNYVENDLGEKRITHIAVAKDIPIKIYDEKCASPNREPICSAQSYLSNYSSMKASGLGATSFYKSRKHFIPSKDIRYAVSYLTGYNLQDIKNMIDNAQKNIGLDNASWILDYDNSGYYSEINSLARSDADAIYNNFLVGGLKPENIYVSRDNIKPINSSKVLFYYGTGVYHSNYNSGHWIVEPGNFNFTVSPRAVMISTESFNAYTFSSTGYSEKNSSARQGLIADAISAQAFSGENYKNSFSGAIGNVDEPYFFGLINTKEFFQGYYSGLTFAESVLASSRPRWKTISIGDPLMKINEISLLKYPGEICEMNEECLSNICDEIPVLYSDQSYKKCVPNNFSCFSSYSSGELVVFAEGAKKCYSTNLLRKCNQGSFNLEEKPSLTGDWICQELLGEDNAIWLKNTGEACLENKECASAFCSHDLYGEKKCTQVNTCLIHKKDRPVFKDFNYCLNKKEFIKCGPNGWIFENLTCKDYCSQGRCDSNYVSGELELHGGDPYYLTLEKNISSLISLINLDEVINLYVFRNGSYESLYTVYLQNQSYNMPIQQDILPGEGFVLNFMTDTKFKFEGIDFQEPVKVKIVGNYSLIGVPFCGKNYTSRSLIKEINSVESGCFNISKGVTFGGPTELWSLKDNSSNTLFNITNYESYFIACENVNEFFWTPSCLPEVGENLTYQNQIDNASFTIKNNTTPSTENNFVVPIPEENEKDREKKSIKCYTTFDCSPWGPCFNGEQNRTCYKRLPDCFVEPVETRKKCELNSLESRKDLLQPISLDKQYASNDLSEESSKEKRLLTILLISFILLFLVILVIWIVRQNTFREKTTAFSNT